MDSRLEIIFFTLVVFLSSCQKYETKQENGLFVSNSIENVDSTTAFLSRLKHIVDSVGFIKTDNIADYYVFQDSVATYDNCLYLDSISYHYSDSQTNRMLYVKNGIFYDSSNIDKCVLIGVSQMKYTGYIYVRNISSCINLIYNRLTVYSILKDNEFYTFYGYNYKLKTEL